MIAFGTHDQEAPRHWNNRILLQNEGWEVIECHVDEGSHFRNLIALYKEFQKKKMNANAVMVTFAGHYFLPLAWLLTRFPRRRLIFDAFISLHEVLVHDRKKVSTWHPYAWFLYCLDYLDCHLADEVWIDSEAHKRFFIQKFHLRPDKIRVVYLGTRSDLFKPAERINESTHSTSSGQANKRINVLFYGTFIPHQGVEYILKAAKILEKTNPAIHITLLGAGQTRKHMEELAKDLKLSNVDFVPRVPFKELPAWIQKADVCLGAFGTDPSVGRVIPHKVYDALACKVPIVTAESEAIREKFSEKDGVYFCRAGDGEDLARIIQLALVKQK
jgi:glycosyltransferase involved in cell wall biosynthesis